VQKQRQVLLLRRGDPLPLYPIAQMRCDLSCRLLPNRLKGRANYDYTTTSLHQLCITTHTTYHCILGVLGATFCHLSLIYLSHYRADDSTCLT
jgi:hypothetical protein